MGNYGGSIPGRKDLVRERPKEVKIDHEITAKARANYCTLTKQRLKKPIAACRLGFLYNKEPLLKALIEKTLPKQFDHITSTKDFVTINIMEIGIKNADIPFICPVTRIEYNGLNKFVLIWSCGCVFGGKALQETQFSNGQKNKSLCLVCNKSYTKEDIVSLNSTQEQQAEIKKHLMEEKEMNKKKKAQKEMEKIQQSKEEEKVGDKRKLESVDRIVKGFEKIESDPAKKVKVNPPPVAAASTNILDKLADTDFQNAKNLENNSDVFKSLFHKEYKMDDKMFFRNVRFGLR